jgi:hypothetical protein
MPDLASAYRTTASHLPAIYQEDAASWRQVNDYLSLTDEVVRSLITELDELGTWLSPRARQVAVPGVGHGSGSSDAIERLLALADELAGWFAYEFPASWRDPDDPDAELDRKFDFLLRVARLWRRRGTPTGFYSWLCVRFGIGPAERPIMIEHFKYRSDDPGADPDDEDAAAHRVTLLVPVPTSGPGAAGTLFGDYRRRRELLEFVERNAPAHLLFRVCWIAADDPRYEDYDPTGVTEVRELLETIATYTSADDGIHLEHDPPSGSPLNRIDLGNLPGPAHR